MSSLRPTSLVFKLALSVMTVLACATTAHATSDIDTTSTWNGSSSIGSFGVPNTATYGQTITTDAAGGILDSFSFYLSSLGSTPFQAYVFAWDGSKATGPALFTSSVLTTGSYSGYQEVSVNTGGVNLAANSAYVLAFSTSGLQTGQANRSSRWGFEGDVYSGGEFVYLNNTDNLSALTSQAWTAWYDGSDLAFKANFSAVAAVPEPETYALFAAGLGLMGWSRRRSARRAIRA
jgi:hypothetical protein